MLPSFPPREDFAGSCLSYFRVYLSCKDPSHQRLHQQPAWDPTPTGNIHPSTLGQGGQRFCGPTSYFIFSPCPVLFPAPPFTVVEPAEHIESNLRHCEVCQPPCHYCKMINLTNPRAETGMPGSSRNDIRGPQYFSL